MHSAWHPVSFLICEAISAAWGTGQTDKSRVVTGAVARQRDRLGVGKGKGHNLISQRSVPCTTPVRQTGHTLYLLHSKCADRRPIDLQDAVPGVDGIAVVGTDVHPVDPEPEKS